MIIKELIVPKILSSSVTSVKRPNTKHDSLFFRGEFPEWCEKIGKQEEIEIEERKRERNAKALNPNSNSLKKESIDKESKKAKEKNPTFSSVAKAKRGESMLFKAYKDEYNYILSKQKGMFTFLPSQTKAKDRYVFDKLVIQKQFDENNQKATELEIVNILISVYCDCKTYVYKKYLNHLESIKTKIADGK